MQGCCSVWDAFKEASYEGETSLEFSLFFHCHLLPVLPIGQTGLVAWVITVFTGQQRNGTEKYRERVSADGNHVRHYVKWVSPIPNLQMRKWRHRGLQWHGSTGPRRARSSSSVSCFMQHLPPRPPLNQSVLSWEKHSGTHIVGFNEMSLISCHNFKEQSSFSFFFSV